MVLMLPQTIDKHCEGIVWLARRLGRYGQKIRAGDVVLSGSCICILQASDGAKIEADFGDFGRVECQFYAVRMAVR